MDWDQLQRFERLGWVEQATPVTRLPDLEGELGIAYLGVKRDDLCQPLHGSTKVRKLDYLLASPPYRDAEAWAGVGAIGSGQLVALAAAARELERRLVAYTFWEPLSDRVVETLAYIASRAHALHYSSSRAALALRHPGALLASELGGAAVVPPGATSAIGMLGMVRAAFELRDQIEAGDLPLPDAIVVPLGSGGTAAGLSVGLALAGVDTRVLAVSAVERPFSGRGRLGKLQRQLCQLCGVERRAVPVTIDRAQVGPGYGQPSRAALEACARLLDHGIELEPIYTGKAMAGLLSARLDPSSRLLFWLTAGRRELEADEGWRERLPLALARRLADPEGEPRRIRRRRFVLVAAATGLAIAYRAGGYPDPGFAPSKLMGWEAVLLGAVAEVWLPFAPAAELRELPRAVDRYLLGFAPGKLRELHAAFAIVEHGTAARARPRLTRLAPSERRAELRRLAASPGIRRLCHDALVELCMLGYYQQPSTFAALGYEGPRVAPTVEREAARMHWPTYDDLRAPPGTLPRGVVR